MEPSIEITDDSLAKYQMAGQIAKRTVDHIVKKAVPGKSLLELLADGNNYVDAELKKVYTDITNKGLSFPLCLSPDNIAGYYTNFNPNDKLQSNSILKIELGVNIDGYHAELVYSMIVLEPNTKYLIDNDTNNNNKKRNVMLACINASKDIFRIMKPGNTNINVKHILEKYATKYNCNLPITQESGYIPGVFSFQISRNILDGYTDDDSIDNIDTNFVHRFILSRDNLSYDFTMIESEFEKDEVYSIDIVYSSGTGKLNTNNLISSVYGRNYEQNYPLKLSTSRRVLNMLNKSTFPVKLNMADSSIRMGLNECLKTSVVKKYTVVSEHDDEYIARIKFTVLVRDEPILICAKSGDIELEKLK